MKRSRAAVVVFVIKRLAVAAYGARAEWRRRLRSGWIAVDIKHRGAHVSGLLQVVLW